MDAPSSSVTPRVHTLPSEISPGVAQRSTFRQKLLLLVASVLVAIAVAEITARLMGWGGVVLFARNDGWGFLMQPSQLVYTYGYPVRINSLGLRGPELHDPKSHNTKRVLFIGDSVTYGGGRIPEEKLFCRIVEAKAKSTGQKIEVVNLSAPAWSPQNWWAYVQEHGLFDADVVILVLPECDLSRMFSTMELGGHWNHAPSLRLVSLARKVAANFGHSKLTTNQRVDDTISANLQAVIGLKQKCDRVPFFAVLVPSDVPRQPNKELWSKFTTHLPDVLDLRQELQDPSYFIDGSHLSVSGHEFVGEKVDTRLRQLLN